MNLATYADGTRDGALHVVSRDLGRCAPAPVPSLRLALESWAQVEGPLRAVAAALNAGTLAGAPFNPVRCLAPLPRASGWMDGSAFLHHGRLMERAFGTPPIEDFDTVPVVYQGGSDDLLGPTGPVPFVSEDHQIDCEGEFGVITDDVPMGVTEAEALRHIKLVVQLNDWSLRRFAPYEMRRGFGWIQAKPSTAFAPVAVTPDALGEGWRDGRVQMRLEVQVNGRRIGQAHAGAMAFSFARLIAHCAATRRLGAGTILGSGTVSNDDPTAGSSCLAEVRVLEVLRQGAPQTPFLAFGDRVRMTARAPDGSAPFGATDHTVARG